MFGKVLLAGVASLGLAMALGTPAWAGSIKIGPFDSDTLTATIASGQPAPFMLGDFGAASRGLFAFLPLNPLLYEESNPVGVKAALEILGVCGAAVRLPLLEASEGLKARIQAAL